MSMWIRHRALLLEAFTIFGPEIGSLEEQSGGDIKNQVTSNARQKGMRSIF